MECDVRAAASDYILLALNALSIAPRYYLKLPQSRFIQFRNKIKAVSKREAARPKLNVATPLHDPARGSHPYICKIAYLSLKTRH